MAEVVWDTKLGQQRIGELAAEAQKAHESAAAARAMRVISAKSREHAAMMRMYAGAKASRLTADWNPTDGSADSELVSSLTNMRSRSRSLIRDSSLACRAQQLVMTNIIGNGIGLQAAVKSTRGVLNKRVNADIEAQWENWCLAEHCHKGKRLAFSLIERFCMGQVFAAGEVFVRMWQDDQGSGIPFSLEVIEAERLADEFTSPQVSSVTGNEIRMGVEVDEFFAPIAYYFRDRHPNEHRFRGSASNALRRIPASEIIHLAVVDRWPQTRGEPWLHTAIRRINDMDGYVEAELVRARVQASTVGAIETPESADSFGEVEFDGSVTMETEPGVFKRLNPGEKLNATSPTAPNPQLDPFMRFMIRELAAGAGVSYESLSRDYSQSNYSSSRLALLDDRDIWRFFQSWFITDFRQRIHRRWMDQAVISRALKSISMESYGNDPLVYRSVRYKPRGWTWVDPTKEVEAYKEAVRCGFTTVTDVVAQTSGGLDIEDILDTRADELKAMREKGLVFETSPEFYVNEAIPPTAPAKAEESGNPSGDPAAEETPKTPAGRVLPFAAR